jgi:hypothetical protein
MDAATLLLVPILLTLRFSFALLLGAAAAHKLRDLGRFRAVMLEYDVLPARFAGSAATAFAAFEALLAGMLAAGVALPAAAASVMALLLVYAAAIAANVARGRFDLDCGCAGPAARVPVSAVLVVRNLVLVVAAAALLAPAPSRALHAIDAASALAATLALAACWLASERMLALAPSAAKLRGAMRRRSAFA